MNVWFHTYFLSLCYIYFIRQVYKCRGCFDSIEHQFPSGRWSCLPWSLPRAGSWHVAWSRDLYCTVLYCTVLWSLPRAGSWHVAWSRDLSSLETRDTWPDPWSDITVSSHHRGSVYLFCIMMQNFQFCINERLWSLIQWELILYDEEYLIFEDYLCESQETLF